VHPVQGNANHRNLTIKWLTARFVINIQRQTANF
jgi:hypothetical protein